MTPETVTPTDVIYTIGPLMLTQAGGAYSYRFRAYVGGVEVAALPALPAPPQGGPVVTSPNPLSWAGTSGYENEGVEPDSAPAGTSFIFKVKYTSLLTVVPTVTLTLTRNLVPVPGSPFLMANEGGTAALSSGAIFFVAVTLNQAGGAYFYRFRAYIGGSQVGSLPEVPAPPQAGPVVLGASLAWAGTAGYENEGVEPDSAPAGKPFTFKAKYTGPAPSAVQLFLTRNFMPVPGSPFAMHPEAEPPAWPATGVIFTTGPVVLNQAGGAYFYRFRAHVGGVEVASLPQVPAPPQSGPIVTGGEALTVSGVTTQQVAGAVTLSYVLSTPAEVEATVLNIAGRPIAQVSSSDVQGAGLQTLRWNGRSTAGSKVPAGTYLIQVTPRSDLGDSATSLCSVQLRR
jgi:hypothetical protein